MEDFLIEIEPESDDQGKLYVRGKDVSFVRVVRGNEIFVATREEPTRFFKVIYAQDLASFNKLLTALRSF